MPEQGSRSNASEASRALKSAGFAGFEFAASVAAFAVGGFLLDRSLDTTPLWTLVGASVGFIGGGYNLYKTVRSMSAAQARDAARTQRPTKDAPPVQKDGPGGAYASGAEHEHVPAFETPDPPKPRRRGGDFGMFARDTPEEDAMDRAEDIKWPEDAQADDTVRPETEDRRDDG